MFLERKGVYLPMMDKYDLLLARLGPRPVLVLKGECRLHEKEIRVTGNDLLMEGTISCDTGIARPNRKDHDWSARFDRAKVSRRHENSLEVEIFSVKATRDQEEEKLLRTILVAV